MPTAMGWKMAGFIPRVLLVAGLFSLAVAATATEGASGAFLLGSHDFMAGIHRISA
jgi:hypothetical protein